MDLTENIREGLRSIKANLLRTVLTTVIIAIGIAALVGIQTAVNAMRLSIENSFSNLGANKVEITVESGRGGRRRGRTEKARPPLKYIEATQFRDNFTFPSLISVRTTLSGTAEVKYKSKTTSPNSVITGGDENYLPVEGLSVDKGRNFSAIELNNGSDVAIIGAELVEVLFDREDPLNKNVTAMGRRFRIVGVLQEQGQIGSQGADRMLLLPLENARSLANKSNQNSFGRMVFEMAMTISDPAKIQYAMGEATGLMRKIRQDAPGAEDSFEVSYSESLTERLDRLSGYLTWGGVAIGAVTLLGASIALMNIMLVNVTERTREIGVRKALGATPKKIRQQFLIEAIVICQVGGVIGIILGLLLGNIVSALLNAGGFVVPWPWIVIGLLVGVAVGLLSGVVPANKAAKLDPIESLRFE